MSLSAVNTVSFPGAGTAIADTTAASVISTTGEARLDMRQRVIVDNAIALLGSSNIMSAFEYLRSHGIRTHVIERVLLEPMRRRASRKVS